MLLRRVVLQNFRSQREGVLDLIGPDEKPVHVMALIGPNGSGKTAWLDAIAGFFTALVPEYGGPVVGAGDVREGASESKVRVEWVEGEERHAGMIRILREPRTTLPEGESHAMPDDDFVTALNNWSSKARSSSRRPKGVVVYFGAHRFAAPATVTGPNASKIISHRIQDALTASPGRPAPSSQRFEQLKQWIVNVEFLRVRAKADRGESLPLWEHLVALLDRLLAPCRFERVTEDFDVLFRTPTGVVSIDRLSSGYQSVLVIVAELLLRLSLSVDDASRMFEVDAVCLVDEIDAHLHPLWQARVLDDLRWAFPRVQFIVTTHSELVVAGLQPYEISVLREVKP